MRVPLFSAKATVKLWDLEKMWRDVYQRVCGYFFDLLMRAACISSTMLVAHIWMLLSTGSSRLRKTAALLNHIALGTFLKHLDGFAAELTGASVFTAFESCQVAMLVQLPLSG